MSQNNRNVKDFIFSFLHLSNHSEKPLDVLYVIILMVEIEPVAGSMGGINAQA